jgi:hypothetical protein
MLDCVIDYVMKGRSVIGTLPFAIVQKFELRSAAMRKAGAGPRFAPNCGQSMLFNLERVLLDDYLSLLQTI